MSMGFMVAAASRNRDDKDRYMDGRMERSMANENNMGGYGRMIDEPEMRRRRDERGRYMDGGDGARMAYDGSRGNYDRMEQGGGAAHYWPEPHMPTYQEKSRNMGREMREEDPHDKRYNPYGEEPEVYKDQRRESYGGMINYEQPDGRRGNVSYFKMKQPQDESRQMKPEKMMGFQQNAHEKMDDEGFTKEIAMEWVAGMEDKEGVKGGAYSWHQAQQYGRNMGITGEDRLLEFYAAINAMESDFRPAGKKFGVDRPEFYACLAKLWLEDPDAVDNKAEEYYRHIVKK